MGKTAKSKPKASPKADPKASLKTEVKAGKKEAEADTGSKQPTEITSTVEPSEAARQGVTGLPEPSETQQTTPEKVEVVAARSLVSARAQPDAGEATSSFAEQLAGTVDRLEALRTRLGDSNAAAQAEHGRLQERLRAAEAEAKRTATSLDERQGRLQGLARDCERLHERLKAAKEALRPEVAPVVQQAAERRTGSPKKSVAEKKAVDPPVEEAFADAESDEEGHSAQEEEEAESRERTEGKEDEGEEEDEDEEEEDSAQSTGDPKKKKGWFGGWFKK